jgi:hypothetical protein
MNTLNADLNHNGVPACFKPDLEAFCILLYKAFLDCDCMLWHGMKLVASS